MNVREVIRKRVALMLSEAHPVFGETCDSFQKSIENKLEVVVSKEIKKIDDRRVFSLASKIARKNDQTDKPSEEEQTTATSASNSPAGKTSTT